MIPSFKDDQPAKIKIRRNDWTAGDALPKYVEISGSAQSLSIYGDISKPLIIVESELDAILIQQEASEFICSIALGGVSKKPDAKLHELLQQAPSILLSLDFDNPGKKHYSFWMRHYSNLKPWPAPHDKSPGDSFKTVSISLLEWIRAGLSL